MGFTFEKLDRKLEGGKKMVQNVENHEKRGHIDSKIDIQRE